MSTDRKLKILFGLLSLGLLISLVIKLIYVPGGMILSGLFIGTIIIVGICFVCFILTALLGTFIKRISALTIFSILASIGLTCYHYELYSPTLTIVVPNKFYGEVHLVLSNVKDNILTVDSNGIGYINKWTFNKVYTRPRVRRTDGKDLDRNLVGFNPSTFWAKSSSQGSNTREVTSLSFEIVPDSLVGQKQYFSNFSADDVDKNLVLADTP